MKKKITILAVFIALLGVCAELFARFYLGLGDPPLSVGDAEIDYIFAPNQDCNRFGNRIVYNDASMRCDFDVLNCRAEKRIFVVGDSVVNGGVLTDHKCLATTILQDRIDPSRKRVQICNVSAGSWGPGNYAAYFRRYRDMVGPNDVIIVEVNSHDLWEDDPVLTGGATVGKDIAVPGCKPFCALWDGFNRYFMPRARQVLKMSSVNTKVDVPHWGADSKNDAARYNLKMLEEVFAIPVAAKYLLIHRTREETRDSNDPIGEVAFRRFAEEHNIPVISLKLNDADYRDTIHMSASGQLKMGELISEVL